MDFRSIIVDALQKHSVQLNETTTLRQKVTHRVQESLEAAATTNEEAMAGADVKFTAASNSMLIDNFTNRVLEIQDPASLTHQNLSNKYCYSDH